MRVFAMCPACQQEFENPLNRRFHAQPNACPVCGPQISLLTKDETGQFCATESHDVIVQTAHFLEQGAIVAIKGLGGYHLACDALNAEAVRRLRQQKHREAKPFALMVPDIEAARQLGHVSNAEARLLQARQRPIVLVRQRHTRSVAPEVAPASDTLGLMLPYTPLHSLLLHAFAETMKPDRPIVLVMTSGNLSDEPIAYKDHDAQERLQPIADCLLTHNREIHMRCDDSVMRIVGAGSAQGKVPVSGTIPTAPALAACPRLGGEQFLRRSRGYAPEPIALPFELPVPLLACGGHLKNTFCLGKERQAFVSQHIGDLENVETLLSFRAGIEHFQHLFAISPQAIAYDLHPEYLATKYALDSDLVPKIGVQHHHAHIASVLAEHGLTELVIGVAADGAGYGTDGAIWGCEILVADLLNFERFAHLAYVPLPGGEQAVHQPWRMAAVYLARTYGDAFLELDIPFIHHINRPKWRLLSQMIAKNLNCPQTSSLGRLFDAVAALIGLHGEVLYEGQAAIALEVLATRYPDPVTSYPFVVQQGKPALLDVIPLIAAIVKDVAQGVPTERIAKRFHFSVAQMLATSCAEVRQHTGLSKVALSGGVFQNQLLLEQLVLLLEEQAFEVYINRLVPPNDGGLSLGQIAVAAATIEYPDQQKYKSASY
jgi:hydrogenase maturation protein HypF